MFVNRRLYSTQLARGIVYKKIIQKNIQFFDIVTKYKNIKASILHSCLSVNK